MVFENGVKNIEAAAYNGERTVTHSTTISNPNVELKMVGINFPFLHISASLTLLERFMQIANCQNSSAFTPCLVELRVHFLMYLI